MLRVSEGKLRSLVQILLHGVGRVIGAVKPCGAWDCEGFKETLLLVLTWDAEQAVLT